ncbi:MAG: SDR family NAD(P)-dependent oxidoreductase [Acidimicrobiales bacterium]
MSAESFDLTGQVAVVTGGGTGIGEGIAKAYAGAGASVVVAARRTEPIERVAADIVAAGGQAIAVQTDVTDRAQLVALADAAVDTYGSLSIWANNAGGSPHRTPLAELDRGGWDLCFDLNVTALWEASVIAAERMEQGSILNISSGAAHRGVPGSGHYAAAKAAVNSLTKTFALELAPRVRVNCICPGWIETEIMMTAMSFTQDDLPKVARQIPMKKMGEPMDVGLAALYFASPAAGWVTGQILDIAGGPVV